MKLTICMATALALASPVVLSEELPQRDDVWFVDGQAQLKQKLGRIPNTNRAKNIIVLIADGNGVGTNLATRIWHGQQQGMLGEENVLSYESFPYLALAKTYNTNAQIPDSSGTATAILTGVKTKSGVVGVNDSVARGDCQAAKAASVKTIAEILGEQGRSIGFVTTARITHATPASGYAHTADRNYEDNSALPEGCTVPDIAAQLLEHMKSGVVDIAMGGGRRHFLPEGIVDEEGQSGHRTDGRNLLKEARALGVQYAWDDATFSQLDLSGSKPVLALFESSHMQYEYDRTNEPSLAEMVKASISALQGNEKGFFLEVEAGRVDHANHEGNLHRTVTDGVAFADAVTMAVEMTNPEDTLIIATADHEHAIAFSGYCGRGTPITGLCYGIDPAGTKHTDELQLAVDGLPYTVAGYLNGPGSVIKEEMISETAAAIDRLHAEQEVLPPDKNNWKATFAGQISATRYEAMATETGDDGEIPAGNAVWIGSRPVLTQDEATDPDFLQQALIPLFSETHSSEDVAIYASGPWAHLIDGTVEQNYIFHVMYHAASAK